MVRRSSCWCLVSHRRASCRAHRKELGFRLVTRCPGAAFLAEPGAVQASVELLGQIPRMVGG